MSFSINSGYVPLFVKWLITARGLLGRLTAGFVARLTAVATRWDTRDMVLSPTACIKQLELESVLTALTLVLTLTLLGSLLWLLIMGPEALP